MTPDTVPCDSDVVVTTRTQLVHRCPYVDETDYGTITLQWRVTGRTIELHSLATYLTAFSQSAMSHEMVTSRIRHDLAVLQGIADVRVETTWDTATLNVRVRSGECGAVLRESVNRESR